VWTSKKYGILEKSNILSNFHYGTFGIAGITTRAACPICLERLYNVRSCGFYRCHFAIEGVKTNREVITESGEIYSNNKFTYFSDEKMASWITIDIRVSYYKNCVIL